MSTESDSVSKLYEKLLRLHPELWQTAQLALRARGRLTYPLTRHEDFLRLANDPKKGSWNLGAMRITLKQAKRYFPRSLFPVEDEDDFIGKTLIALLWGKAAHGVEAGLAYRPPKKTKPRSRLTRRRRHAG